MIKAEIINHEGNPGPNWLDRCRSLISPGSMSVFIALVAVAGLTFALLDKRSNSDTESAAKARASTPASVAEPLTVQSITTQTYQGPNGNTTVQAASGGAENPMSGAQSDSPQTTGQSPLNTTSTTPDAGRQNDFNQGALRNRSLLNTIQTVLPSFDTARNGNGASQKDHTNNQRN